MGDETGYCIQSGEGSLKLEAWGTVDIKEANCAC